MRMDNNTFRRSRQKLGGKNMVRPVLKRQLRPTTCLSDENVIIMTLVMRASLMVRI